MLDGIPLARAGSSTAGRLGGRAGRWQARRVPGSAAEQRPKRRTEASDPEVNARLELQPLGRDGESIVRATRGLCRRGMRWMLPNRCVLAAASNITRFSIFIVGPGWSLVVAGAIARARCATGCSAHPPIRRKSLMRSGKPTRRDRHAEFFLALGEEAEPSWTGRSRDSGWSGWTGTTTILERRLRPRTWGRRTGAAIRCGAVAILVCPRLLWRGDHMARASPRCR